MFSSVPQTRNHSKGFSFRGLVVVVSGRAAVECARFAALSYCLFYSLWRMMKSISTDALSSSSDCVGSLFCLSNGGCNKRLAIGEFDGG